MSTKNARSRRPFVRSTSQRNGDGIRALHIRAPIESSQSILATGKHHLSAWLGTREISGIFETTDCGYLTKVTPGPNASFLQLSFLIQQVSAESSLHVVTDSDNAKTIPAGVESSSSLSNLEEVLFEFAVVGGIETDIYFATNGDYLVKGLTICDSPASYLESVDEGYRDLSQYYKGKEITVSAVQGIVDCQESILANLRKIHANLASYIDDEPLETVEPTSSLTNFFDTTLSAYSQDEAPGFWIRPGAHYHGDGKTRVRCRVKASSSSGTGILRFLASSDATTADIALSSTVDWYSSTLDLAMPSVLQGQYAEKIELHCQDATASSTIDIYNILIEEMDGTL